MKQAALFIIMLMLAGSSARAQVPADSAAVRAERLAREFVGQLSRKEYAKAVTGFDAKMTEAMPAAKLQQAWESVIGSVGAFQAIEGARQEQAQGYRIVYVTCRFAKQKIDVRVVLDATSKIAGLFFAPAQTSEAPAPAYADRSLFRESEVTVGEGEWKLPGTLTLPTGKGPFPAVVLVHGSGPNDRNESIGPNRPFRDIAWGLASRGVAVLRYEKRTKEHGANMAAAGKAGLTVREETVDDAQAAVALLAKTAGIDPKRIFVLGHSLGGMLIPRIAAGRTDIAGCIVLAGAARPLEDLMLEQTAFQASLAGQVSAETNKAVEDIRRQIAAIKKIGAATPDTARFMNAPASYWRDLAGYRPAEAARTLKQPLLVLQGVKDCQVSAERDFPLWQKALDGRPGATLKLYPTLNHLFMPVDGMSTGAEYQTPANVAGDVITDIAAWIKAR